MYGLRRGYIGFAYGIGVVVGPALGGYLSFSSLRATAWIAVAGTLLSIMLVLVFQSGTKHVARSEVSADAKHSTASLWHGYKRIWQSPALLHALMVGGWVEPSLVHQQTIFNQKPFAVENTFFIRFLHFPHHLSTGRGRSFSHGHCKLRHIALRRWSRR
jgi:MFS family permease